jgi:hypothetical protein
VSSGRSLLIRLVERPKPDPGRSAHDSLSPDAVEAGHRALRHAGGHAALQQNARAPADTAAADHDHPGDDHDHHHDPDAHGARR